jgi:hypothetical protein
MAALPVTTTCYAERLCELRDQLKLLRQQCLCRGLSEELENLLNQQIRCIQASLWSIHAEMEDD